MSRVLVIIDVQAEFSKFMQNDLVDELYDYAEKFEKVYQIWDSNKNQIAPTYEFPNQVGSIKKKFGRNHFNNKVQKFTQDVEDVSEEGTTFKLTKGNGYIVRVDNNHQWFFVNPEITNLIEELEGNEIVLVGGADGECLEDVKVAFEAFDLNYRINKKYVYSATTDKNDTIEDNVNEAKELGYDELCYKVNGLEDENFIKTQLESLGYTWDINPRLNGEYYLFVLINGQNSVTPLSFDRVDNVRRFDNIEHYAEIYDFSVYPRVFNRENFIGFESILKHGGIVPNYKPRRKLNESARYEYKEITYDVVDDTNNQEIQEYLFKQGFGWPTTQNPYNYYEPKGIYPVYLFVDLWTKTITRFNLDDLHWETEGGNIQSFVEDDIDMDNVVYNKSSESTFKQIIEKGTNQRTPDYRPRKKINENRKTNRYPYTKLAYRTENEKENREIQQFLFDNGKEWSDIGTKFKDFDNTYPYYVYVNLQSKNILFNTFFDTNYVNDQHYYSNIDKQDFMAIIKYGQIAPNYRPRKRKLDESVKNLLKGKSDEEIENAMEELLSQVTDMAIEMYPKKFDDWVDTYNYFEKHQDRIKEILLLNGYTIRNAIFNLVEGWGADDN